jgi:hypothetical protein
VPDGRNLRPTVCKVLARRPQITLTAGGIEGVVINDADAPYPTRDGQRVWWKVKARSSVDMLAIGYTDSHRADQLCDLRRRLDMRCEARILVAPSDGSRARRACLSEAALARPL